MGDFLSVGPKNETDQGSSSSDSSERLLRKFLKFKDTLGGQKVRLDFLDGLLASEDLDADLDSVAVGFLYMSTLYAHAEQRHDDYKIHIDKIKSQLDEEARDGVVTGRVTDAKVLAYIKNNPRYIKASKRLSRYNRQRLILKAAAEAYTKKLDALRSKAANNRINEGNHLEPNDGKKAYSKVNIEIKNAKLKKKRKRLEKDE